MQENNRKPSLTQLSKLPWPENLITAIGVEEALGEKEYRPLTEEQWKGLEHVFQFLRSRDREILRGWFEEHRSLSDIGTEFEITRERVSQIIHLSLKRLQMPDMTDMIRNGRTDVEPPPERPLRQVRQGPPQYRKARLQRPAPKKKELTSLRPEEIRGLSAEERTERFERASLEEAGWSRRVSIVLRQAGRCRTVADVVKMIEWDIDTFKRIRNFGIKSQAEVLDKLEEFGLDCTLARNSCGLVHRRKKTEGSEEDTGENT